MAPSQKTTETGTAQVPRTCNGFGQGRSPTGYFSLGGLEPIGLRGLVRVDPNQWPQLRVFFGAREKGAIDLGILDLSRYRRDPRLRRAVVQRGYC
jgi:hypothetical protein